jgi:preprotein translocase subunit SecA
MSNADIFACSRPYPERAELRPRWADRTIAAIAYLPQRLYTRAAAAWRARRPALFGARESVAQLDDAALQEALLALRLPLRRDGLTGPAPGLALSIVAEMAARAQGTRALPETLAAARAMLAGAVATGREIDQGMAAALAAAVNALAGLGVHVLYGGALEARLDAARFRSLFTRLALTVGVVDSASDRATRVAAYTCDVVYAHSRDVAFDYLRDRIALRGRTGPTQLTVDVLLGAQSRRSELILRGLQCAILVRGDELLIDDARAPVALSTDSSIGQESALLNSALEVTATFLPGVHYQPATRGLPELTPQGSALLEEVGRTRGGLWSGRRHREELAQLALAIRAWQRDVDYRVHADCVELSEGLLARSTDQAVQRIALRALLELREGCVAQGTREVLARLSMQRFYRRYVRLTACSASAGPIARELWRVFGLRVIPALAAPFSGDDAARGAPCDAPALSSVQVCSDFAAKSAAVVERIEATLGSGQAAVVSGSNAPALQALSAQLEARAIDHRLLVGRDDADEARQFAQAARARRVTLVAAWSAAGIDVARANDQDDGAKGLALIFLDTPESARHERERVARCRAAAIPVSVAHIVALDDPLIAAHAIHWIGVRLARHGASASQALARIWLAWAQAATEREGAHYRGELLKREEYWGDVLSFAGRHN